MLSYPLAKNLLTEEDKDALKDFIDRGMFTMGKEVQEFEMMFSDVIHTNPHSVMTNSGSSANLLLIAAYVSSGKLKAGDKVVVPAVSWSTTYFPLIQYGLIPVFVDVDHTYQADVNEVIQAVEKHDAKAIFLVNLLGLMDCDYIYGLKLHESTKKCYIFLDNCEGFGASQSYKDFDGVTHSFFFSHHLNTMEGGMVTFKDETVWHHSLSLRAHGWTRNLPENNAIYHRHGDDFRDSFTFVTVGYCLRPLEMSGFLGKRELNKWEETKEIRDRNHLYFNELFEDSVFLGFNVIPYSWSHSIFGFPLVFNSPEKRKKAVDILTEMNVSCRPIISGNFLNQPVMRKIEHIEGSDSFEMAETIDKCGLMIGNYGEDLRENLKKIYTRLENEL
jgi:CDP-4-dehydro-6-deoxyglucose reductase, E1